MVDFLNTSAPRGLYPDQTFPYREIVPNALFTQLTTFTQKVEGDTPALRVPYVSEDPEVGFVAEGAAIPIDNATISELVISTRKLAVISTMTREAATNTTAEQFVGESMRRAITAKIDNAFFNNNDPVLKGLLNISGIHDGGTMAAADLDVLTDAITAIEGNGATASHIVMHPGVWGELQKLKTATGSAQLLLGSPAEQATKQLFGIPVITNAQVPANTIVVLDKNDILSVAGDIMLEKSTEAFFGNDAYAYRALWRTGWGAIHPNRLAKITLAPAE